jgi:hypothetical protein
MVSIFLSGLVTILFTSGFRYQPEDRTAENRVKARAGRERASQFPVSGEPPYARDSRSRGMSRYNLSLCAEEKKNPETGVE